MLVLLSIAAVLCAADIDELHKAARSGDLKHVEALVGEGVPVNARDSLGGTPLHDAAWAGHTALDLAIANSQSEVVEVLKRRP